MSEEAIYKLHRYPSGELEEFEYVQKLVRCKECKRRYRSGYRGDEYWVCDFMDAKIKDEDFCSYGERRNDG